MGKWTLTVKDDVVEIYSSNLEDNYNPVLIPFCDHNFLDNIMKTLRRMEADVLWVKL